MPLPYLIDTHAHLAAADFAEDLPQVIERASAAGVKQIVSIGAGFGATSTERTVEIAQQYPNVYATVGIHPCDAHREIDFAIISELARRPKVVAIGEAGLDFLKGAAPREQQIEVFIKQVRLAQELKLPLIIHSRNGPNGNAGAECLEILSRPENRLVGGVFHCYAEDAEFAEQLLAINFLVSFPGTLTFKKADALRAVVAGIPIEQIVVETDAPFMAPEPNRGKRCESAFVRNTAEELCRIKNIAQEVGFGTTTRNAQRLFKLPTLSDS